MKLSGLHSTINEERKQYTVHLYKQPIADKVKPDISKDTIANSEKQAIGNVVYSLCNGNHVKMDKMYVDYKILIYNPQVYAAKIDVARVKPKAHVQGSLFDNSPEFFRN